MSVTIGVISGELLRYSQFTQTLLTAQAPPDTRITWASSCSITGNLNAVTEMALETGSDYLWILGDDHIIPKPLLMQLLAHAVPIVAPMCVMRAPPYQATVFTRTANGLYEFRQLEGGRQGLIEVDACGNAGMLIHRDVLLKMPEPWWEGGKIDPSKLTEDLYFCEKARALGFPVYVDTEHNIGHITSVSLWPSWKDDGRLGAKVAVSGNYVYDDGVPTVRLL
jgi:hypothetical protein